MKYKTRVEKIEKNSFNNFKEIIQLGAKLINKGELVAFPTETVYGLGADATNAKAVKKIFEVKGRPQDNPLIVHISTLEQLKIIIKGVLPEYAKKLISTFWPGPLTIIFTKSKIIPATTTANLDSVALRMPAHPIAKALIEKANLPIAAPSANISTLPSPTLAEHVFHDLKGRIPLIIDGGPCQVGLESTVVDVRGEKPIILRPGGVSKEVMEKTLGFELISHSFNKEFTPVSPGMKYQHYSPNTPLILIMPKLENKFRKIIEDYSDKKIALVLTKETKDKIHNISVTRVIEIGSKENLEYIGTRLFAILRELDQGNFDFIMVEALAELGLGEAIMNRLKKAAFSII